MAEAPPTRHCLSFAAVGSSRSRTSRRLVKYVHRTTAREPSPIWSRHVEDFPAPRNHLRLGSFSQVWRLLLRLTVRALRRCVAERLAWHSLRRNFASADPHAAAVWLPSRENIASWRESWISKKVVLGAWCRRCKGLQILRLLEPS